MGTALQGFASCGLDREKYGTCLGASQQPKVVTWSLDSYAISIINIIHFCFGEHNKIYVKKSTISGKLRLSTHFELREAIQNFTLPVTRVKQTHQFEASNLKPLTLARKYDILDMKMFVTLQDLIYFASTLLRTILTGNIVLSLYYVCWNDHQGVIEHQLHCRCYYCF